MQITKKWFDQECEKGKKNCKKNSHNINNSELRQLLREKKKTFKQICGRKKRESISKGTSTIDMRAKRPGNK